MVLLFNEPTTPIASNTFSNGNNLSTPAHFASITPSDKRNTCCFAGFYGSTSGQWTLTGISWPTARDITSGVQCQRQSRPAFGDPLQRIFTQPCQRPPAALLSAFANLGRWPRKRNGPVPWQTATGVLVRNLTAPCRMATVLRAFRVAN